MTSRIQHTLFVSLSLTALSVVAGCGSDSTASAPVTDSTAADTPTSVAATDPPLEDAASPDTEVGSGASTFHTGPLDAGVYAGNKFSLPVTFEVADGWEGAESPDSLLLMERLSDDSELEFGGEIGLLATVLEMSVDEVVAALQATTGVVFSEPSASTVAGLDGFVLTADAVAEDVMFEWMYDPVFESPWYAFAGTQQEVHVLEHESGTLIVWMDALPAGWETFRAQAQPVLDSIVWSE
ncbi:MAG: hypothetical protein ACM3MM_00780 [Acidobacteriota bacterium]